MTPDNEDSLHSTRLKIWQCSRDIENLAGRLPHTEGEEAILLKRKLDNALRRREQLQQERSEIMGQPPAPSPKLPSRP